MWRIVVLCLLFGTSPWTKKRMFFFSMGIREAGKRIDTKQRSQHGTADGINRSRGSLPLLVVRSSVILFYLKWEYMFLQRLSSRLLV